jgi:TRADD-N domain-containing protein
MPFAEFNSRFLLELLGAFGATLAASLSVYALLRSVRRDSSGFSVEFQPMEEEVEAVRQRLTPSGTKDREDWEFRLLSEYHAQGLTQSRTSFRVSLFFASLGFVVIAVAVVFAIADETTNAGTTVSLIAGAIVEAVAGLFFVQSNRAAELMTTFFDRLRADRKLRDALELAKSIDDSRLRSRLQTQLALSMAETSESEGTLDLLLRPELARDGSSPVV